MSYRWLLTNGNRELRKDGIFTWSIPALSVKTTKGEFVSTCPNADACASLCYARSGTYRFKNVKAAHLRNLEMILDDLNGWRSLMEDELNHPRYDSAFVRIHDSGDFFSSEYLDAWIEIAERIPDVTFYAYTKEVKMVKSRQLPSNFVIVFSMGGKQDHFIDKDNDRHAEVFPSLEALEFAGYSDQGESDLLAITLPTNKIGIVANKIPHLKKKQGDATFGEIQEKRTEKRK
jgi:Gene product 88